MKNVYFSFFVSIYCGIIVVALWTSPAHAIGPKNFPGDGAGDGQALSYTDNGNGTFTDNNTKFMWEIKDQSGGVHDVDNTYSWTVDDGDLTDPDGTLFTAFLDKLNNKCDGDETTPCATNRDCAGIGNGKCGHAGFRDWCIPNVKKLQSIVDYGTFDPASSFPGATAASGYWSATTFASSTSVAWLVFFLNGPVSTGDKTDFNRARAMRPCP
ncbi:MAG: hypothetical protein HW396_971 [Candidatus Dadabacteria bacterium]|nr:hypothetical protein [Candidatus Dadabacteria bacterium]